MLIPDGVLEEHNGKYHVNHNGLCRCWLEGRIIIHVGQLITLAGAELYGFLTYCIYESGPVEDREIWIENTEIVFSRSQSFVPWWQTDCLDRNPRIDVQR